MLNICLFTNRQAVGPYDLPAYMARFNDAMPAGYLEGKGFYTELKPMEHFFRGFYHIRNEVPELKDRFYVLADLDFSLYSDSDFIEQQVFPVLKEELNRMQDTFNVDMVERIQRDDAALYVFQGNGKVFNEAISLTIRGSMKVVN